MEAGAMKAGHKEPVAQKRASLGWWSSLGLGIPRCTSQLAFLCPFIDCNDPLCY